MTSIIREKCIHTAGHIAVGVCRSLTILHDPMSLVPMMPSSSTDHLHGPIHEMEETPITLGICVIFGMQYKNSGGEMHLSGNDMFYFMLFDSLGS